MKKLYLKFCCLFFICVLDLHVHGQIITTVAGYGASGTVGDGGAATAAEISAIENVCTDYSGNFYISSFGSNRIRKVDAYGIITRFAGNGTSGFSGDGGPASAAQLYSPHGVCSDPSGNIYICDWSNNRVRKVNTSGIISTFAGTGAYGYSGEGGPATAATIGECWGVASDASGNIFIADYTMHRVHRVDGSTGIIKTIAGNGTAGFSGDGGPATAAQLNTPEYIACDFSGNVYVCDWSMERIRKINMSTGIISTVAGNGSRTYGGDGAAATIASFYDPAGIALDDTGNLYICDFYSSRLRKVDTSGIINTVAGTGSPGFTGDGGLDIFAQITNPYGIGIDAQQNIFFSDYNNHRIRKITGNNRRPYFTGGHNVSITVCGNTIGDSLNSILPIYDTDAFQVETWSLIVPAVHGTAACADTTVSTGATVPAHQMYYTPTTGYSGLDSFKVRIFDGMAADTTEVHVLINPTSSAIIGGTSCYVGGYTTLYDSTSDGTYSSSTTSVATVGGTTGIVTGTTVGTSVVTYTLASTGCNVNVTVNVLPYAGLLIKTIAGNGTAGFSGDGGAGISAKLYQPWGVAADYLGNVFIADADNYRVRKVNASDIITTYAGNGTSGYTGDSGPATAAEINITSAVAVDLAGNRYIADYANYCIRKVNASGVITTIAGIAGLSGFTGDGGPATAAKMSPPTGIAVDASGNVYFADDANSRLRKVSNSGIITTVAGIGSTAFSGDGGAATLAAIGQPYGVSIDLAGNIYVSDNANARVRKINTSGIISTYAGSASTGFSGDGGAATLAGLSNPCGIVMDGLGNLYIADASTNRIRKVNNAGIISTVVGNGTAGFGGDACIATGGVLNVPTGVAVDGNGNLYIADMANQRVREVTNNHAPAFTSGHIQTLSVCQGSTFDSINTQMKITDADNQGENLSVVVGPAHGAINASYTATSTGGTITPTGLWYTPTTSYAGNDSFKVQVTDCSGATDTTWVRVAINLPAAPITGTLNVCVGLTTILSDIVPGGVWTSTNPAAGSIGSATGVVTGISSGTTIITYSPGAGCSATVIVTVNPAPAAITGNPSICIGLSNTLADATTGGTWSSSATGIAPVTSGGSVSGSALGTATIIYIAAGCPSLMVVTVNPLPPPITGIFEVCQGVGITLIESGGGTWVSSSPGIGSIDATSGILYGISPGSTTATYTLPTGCTVNTSILVDGLPLAITGPTSVCIGGVITLHDATIGGLWSNPGFYATADTVTGNVTGTSFGTATISYTIGTGCASTYNVSVNASPSMVTGLALMCVGTSDTLRDSVSGGAWSSSNTRIATIGSSNGVVTADSAGSVTITYGTGTCSRTFTVSVSALPAAILGPNSVCVGLTATETDATTGGTWSMVPTTTGTISSGGVVRGIATGVGIVSYTNGGGCSAIKTITVNTIPLGITGTLNVCVGATTTLGDGSGGGVWSSSAITYGTIGSASGIVTGIAPGPTTITYSLGAGCSTTATVTVNGLPGTPSGPSAVCQNSIITLTDAGSGTWTSNNTNVGVVSGTVTGVTAGTDVITYTLPTGCYATKPITINALPGIIGGPTSVCSGSSITLTDGGIGTWGVTGPAIIMGGTGVLTGSTGSGTAVVTYSLTAIGCARTTPVTVNPLPATIAGMGSICPGGSITLSGPTGGVWSCAGAGTVGSSSGVVTGSTAGTLTITYTLPTGCYRTAAVTVNAAPPAIGGPSAVCLGSHITLTDGIGTWISSTSGTATIGSTTGIVAGVATGTSNITFTSGAGCTVTTTVTVSSSPTAITGAATVCSGSTTTLTDTVGGGLWSAGTGTGAVSVGSLSGVVTGVSVGAVSITYSLGSGCTVTRTETVSAAPANILGSNTICVGTTTSLTDATIGGTWSIAPTTVGTISTAGTVHGIAAGTAYVNYSAGGCSVNDTITVNETPAAIGGPASVCQNAVITATDGVSGGAWSTTSSNITIDGTTGSVLGVNAGTAVITYAIGSCAVNRTITINPISAITGATGICVGNTTTLSDATTGGRWSGSGTGTVGSGSGIVNGSSAGVVNVTYTTTAGCIANYAITVNTSPSVIGGTLHVCVGNATNLSNTAGGGLWSTTSININIGSTSGIVTGINAGTAPVTYSLGSGCSVNAVVTVNLLPSAITGTMNVCPGGTTTLIESGGGLWSSGAIAHATVGSSTGIVTGAGAGVATISFTSLAGCVATTVVTVNPLPDLISGAASICEGSTTTMSDASTGGIWSTSSAPIVIAGSSSPSCIVTGVSVGTGVVSYALPTGCATTTSIYVNAAPPAITGTTVVCIGSSTTLSNTSPGGGWSSFSGAVAVGSSSGVVSGISLGTGVVSYTLSGCSVMTTMTVNSLPDNITGNDHLCVGVTDTLTDAGGGVWTSSNPSVATIGSANGVVTGVIPGTVAVSYSLGVGCAVSRAFTVNATPASITGPSTLCVGSTVTLHDVTTGGLWSSSSGAVAAGSSSGVVTGVSGGTVDISYTSTTTGCASVYPVAVIQVPAIIGSTHICAWGSTMMVSDSFAGGSFTSTLVTVSDSGLVLSYAPGTATITYTESHGCFVVANITVNPLPGDITGVRDICVGASTTLSDTSVGGVWSVASGGAGTISTAGVFDGLTMGVANISYTTGRYGCSQSMTITVDAAPTSAGTITGSSNVCAGSTITLSDATAGGVWSAASATVGSSSGIVSATSAGVATIDYTVSNHCGSIAATKTLTVNADVVPTISINTLHDTVCAGTGVSFTSAIINGGAGPVYQWQVNGGIIAGAIANTYSYTPVNGDVVKATLTSDANCAVPASVVSNTITMTVDPQLIPVVAITAAPTGPVLVGETITFTATVTNGGATPTYQWLLNGAAIPSATNATYAASNLSNADIVTCVVTSSGPCGGNSSPSNGIEVIVVSNAGVTSPGRSKGAVILVPNPSRGSFIVEGALGTTDEEVQIIVTDVLGQQMYVNTTKTRNGILHEQVQLGNTIANGMYLVSVHSASGSYVFHLVVEQ